MHDGVEWRNIGQSRLPIENFSRPRRRTVDAILRRTGRTTQETANSRRRNSYRKKRQASILCNRRGNYHRLNTQVQTSATGHPHFQSCTAEWGSGWISCRLKEISVLEYVTLVTKWDRRWNIPSTETFRSALLESCTTYTALGSSALPSSCAAAYLGHRSRPQDLVVRLAHNW